MMKRLTNLPRRQPGFSLMEILIAIVVFAVGMMALAQFQGGLTRSSADANARTLAYNTAEEIIEDSRGFGLLGSDPSSDVPAYDEIVDSSYSVTRGGVSFDVTQTVTDYYYDRATDGFVTTNELDKSYSDMKVLTINVSWNLGDSPDFRIDDSQVISVGDIGSGEITLSTVIKSSTSQTSSVVLTQESNNQITPVSPYTPGERPDVIGLDLGGSRFKESLTPVPEVISRDELVETNFDVITYAQSGEGSLFLRLENFKSVTCECALGIEDGTSLTGEARRPTVWAADEYDVGELVTKVTGHSDNNNQSFYCDVCCRDHHDSPLGEGEDANDEGRYQYNPWRPRGEGGDYWTDGALDGDHKHWGYDQTGVLQIADAIGEHYEESCRMVRVDGFFRVAHDFRREGLLAFPWDYFNYSDNVSTYSGYVTGAVADLVQAIDETTEYYYAATPAEMAAPADGTFPAGTTLPTYAGDSEQQLRSRGIYLDFMSAELREVLKCLDGERGEAGSAETCSNLAGNSIELDAIGSENFLEAIPFFDVQLTWLNRWTEDPVNNPVDTTNEAVADNNAHSRGRASMQGGPGSSTVFSTSHRGNIGFTDTDPIDQRYQANTKFATLAVDVLTDAPDPPAGVTEVYGSITSGVPGVQASRVEIEASDALCNRTNTGYVCWITGNQPRITFDNFVRNNNPEGSTICSTGSMSCQRNDENAANPRVICNLTTASTGVANDLVVQTSCN